MESAQRELAPGETVTARGEQWRVAHADQFSGCVLVTLDGVEHANAGVRFTLVAPFDTIATVALKKPRRRKRTATLRAALATIAGARPARGLWTAAGARVDLLAYQLEPALAVLGGATRVLLADGVGLGKTIQAGLILCELRARGLVDRALILTPAGLRDGWAEELRDRFGVQPAVFDQSAIASQLPGLPAGFNPWMAHAIVIASIDLVKRPEVMAAVEQAPFDLLIADEAHHLTPGSDRGAAVARLATRTPWVVLASATPHSGDDAAFDYLTRIGECDDRIAIFRRTRSDVGIGSGRRVHLLPVTPSSLEMRMLRGVESYARAIWLGRGAHHRGARLVAILLARRAASSATALERTLRRRLQLIAGRDPVPAQQALPWDDADEADGDAPAELLDVAGLDDGAREIRLLEDLIATAAEARSNPTKISRIARVIDRVREPVVVFTEYRDTLDALSKALCGSRKIGALHGGLPAAMRAGIVREFNHGGLDLLIATDTAGEGLNLHHRCRLVIDVELPWNPLRLEQRIGRVDRLGQQRRVHAIRLLHRGTVEDTVLAHLERRRLRAGAALNLAAEEWLGEDDIAAAALGFVAPPPRLRPLLTSVTVSAAGAEAQRLAQQRTVASRCGARPPDRALWSPPRHRFNASTEMVVLSTLQQPGSQGRIAGEACRALLIRMRGCPPTLRDWQAWVNHLVEQLESLIAPAGVSYAAEVAEQLDPLRVSVCGRIETARDRLRRSASSELQASLFDGRVERLAAARRQAVDRLDAALLRRALSLTPAPPAAAARPQLIAAWPLER